MGLTPETFWNLTLTEWRAMLAGFAERHRPGARVRAADAMRLSELHTLMRQYPDA